MVFSASVAVSATRKFIRVFVGINELRTCDIPFAITPE
jgi:hypothetical protein